ncbi:hypothetical protein EJ06DRAFT_425852 [Trichodelitschia bisporula]|uniref:Uncharacterized protein n=1 Tax=Trichodelitschia bisporula TaxID=703511 RepID=A0A6G1HWB4_9PEZI|nr:hypothetical protein EJ06DRAFT_425852 [Trichodelitschia bisporula]
MASRKDMRRADLAVVPYTPPPKESDGDMAATMASTMPMIAIVTRNKILGWSAVLVALQSWLGESSTRAASTPGYFSVGMAMMSLCVTYLPLFLPPPPGVPHSGSETQPPAASPLP